MSVQDAKAFLKKIGTDPQLVKKLEAAPTDEAKQKIAQDLGFTFSKDDLRAVAEEYKGELSDADLEMVAGGASAAWVGVGAGIAAGVVGAAAGGVGAAAATGSAAAAAI